VVKSVSSKETILDLTKLIAKQRYFEDRFDNIKELWREIPDTRVIMAVTVVSGAYLKSSYSLKAGCG